MIAKDKLGDDRIYEIDAVILSEAKDLVSCCSRYQILRGDDRDGRPSG